MLRILLITVFFIHGCASSLQGMPEIVGLQDGKSLYSISGYTEWGQVEEQQAFVLAEKFSKENCKSNPTIIRVETTPAHNLIGSRALRWMAIYECDIPR